MPLVAQTWHGLQLQLFNPYSIATNNIVQQCNGPEYWYQQYWSGLVYNSIEF